MMKNNSTREKTSPKECNSSITACSCSTEERRVFLKTALVSVTLGISSASVNPLFPVRSYAVEEATNPLFKISLAQWSLHRMLFAGKLENLDFPALSKNEFGIDAVEYVNAFFKDKAEDLTYLDELKRRCDDLGVFSHLIMVDDEGDLGDPDSSQRDKAVEQHYRWVEAAKRLGCLSIRVNARSEGSPQEQQKLAADGLRRLSVFASDFQIDVIVENHGGLSSNGKWLAGVMALVDLANCGTLPEFGNFRISPHGAQEEVWYDRYQGTAELMPYAKAVSAKSHEFDDQGNEVRTDYFRMMKIVLAAGFHGYVGIEWEGERPGEMEGIRLTRQLLERVREQLS